MTNSQRVHGPPRYFTIDWPAAKRSVQALAVLQPAAAGTGHGLPMFGLDLMSELQALALHFEDLAMPRHGRYVNAPAITDTSGVLWLPPPAPDPLPKIAAAVVIGAGIAGIYAATQHRRHRSRWFV
jgi:hypothetical protein